MKKVILLFLLTNFIAFAQVEKEIDSLNQVLITTKDIQTKVNIYRELTQIYLINDKPKAQKTINILYDLNKNESCTKCAAMADYLQAKYYTDEKFINQNKVIDFYKKSISKSIAIKDYDFYSIAMMHFINFYINKNKLDIAAIELQKYLELTKKVKFTDYYNSIYHLYGKLYKKKGYYNLALDNFLLAEKHFVYKFSDDISVKINDLHEIALMYAELNNKKKVDLYMNESLQLLKKTSNPTTIINSNFRLAEIEYKIKNYKKSLFYLTKILKPSDTSAYIMYKYDIALLLGQTYEETNDLNNASFFTKMAISEFSKVKDTIYLVNALNNNAKIEIKKGNFLEAKTNIDLAKKIINKSEINSDLLDLYDTEIDYLKKIKKYDYALDLIDQKEFYQTKYNEKTNLATLNEQDIRFQTSKKETQIKLLSAQNDLAKKQKFIYISLLGFLIVIGGILFYAYRNKIKTAQKLNELNELKSRFFANISHEFRTPLTLIKSPVQSLQSELTDENQKVKLSLIDKNANRMLSLVDQLLQLSKIDSGKLKLILKEGNIATFLKYIIEPFDFQAKQLNIKFSSIIQKTEDNNFFDKDVIEKIVINLVSNAFKYSPEKASISFTSSIDNYVLKLIISNTATQLTKEDLPKLFERFYQKNELQQGVGIGLALVKELVELYQGKITTTIENGTLSFSIDLPLEKSNANAIILINDKVKSNVINNLDLENDFPILLIVDDNAEIRSVLKDIFKENYQIIEAQDGEQALKIARKEIPDCIISDVMMPVMNGFEFTKAIKNDELTSFVPVILLTAKTSDEAHLEGLKSTADAYLTKPFNNEIVKATVIQLIAERKKLQERYSQELVLRPTDIVINSVDEKFVDRLQKALDNNVSNADYSADNFAKDAQMSRMQLHRKLKTLFGVSATEFLRNERLKIAAELLLTGNGSISDVAYSVGFNDLSYFSKCFKEYHDCTPSDMLDSSKKNK